MVTTREIRVFAADCQRWAREAENSSDRETITRAARVWLSTAAFTERRLGERAEPCDDLRMKLN
jgi:hypothetical protein